MTTPLWSATASASESAIWALRIATSVLRASALTDARAPPAILRMASAMNRTTLTPTGQLRLFAAALTYASDSSSSGDIPEPPEYFRPTRFSLTRSAALSFDIAHSKSALL